MLRISPDEYRTRLEALHTRVQKAGLDLFVVSALDSLYYLTGAGFEPLERPFFLLVRSRQAPVLLVPKLEHEHIKKAHGIATENIRSYWEFPAPAGRGWPDLLLEHIGNAQTVGIEPSLRRDIADRLRSYSLRTEPLVERLRIVKSKTEIDMIRRAARYADFGVQRLLGASYYGATVAEGFVENRKVMLRIVREVDDWEALTTRVVMATWAAPRSAMPHSVPELNDRLAEGPHVAVVLIWVNGYAAESERTYFTAPPSRDVHTAFGALMEARRIAFGMIRPGLPCAELDAVVTAFLRTQGYDGEDRRLHRTGHGFGLGNHEAPWIAEGSDDRLAEQMVISIEPGIYLSGIGGIRHSDTVLVTKKGPELLTRYPIDLDALTVRRWKLHTRIKGHFVRCALGLADKCWNSQRE
jgi:Xaa-Pro dipeptidase